MKILVAGAAGHIGSALIRHPGLVAECSEIILVDNMATQRYPSFFDLTTGKYRLVIGDVRNVVTAELLEGVSAVVHLAAIADPGLSVEAPELVWHHNLAVTQHLVDECSKGRVPIVFPSSTSVYSASGPSLAESADCSSPATPYARCKLVEEAYIQDEFTRGLRGSIFRFGTIFGTSPGMRFHTAVNRFCLEATLGVPLHVFSGALDKVRPYLSVQDAVEAIVTTLRTGIYAGDVVNLASCAASVSDVIESIRSCDVQVRVEFVDSLASSEHSFGVSMARANSSGIHCPNGLESGILETMHLLRGIRGWP